MLWDDIRCGRRAWGLTQNFLSAPGPRGHVSQVCSPLNSHSVFHKGTDHLRWDLMRPRRRNSINPGHLVRAARVMRVSLRKVVNLCKVVNHLEQTSPFVHPPKEHSLSSESVSEPGKYWEGKRNKIVSPPLSPLPLCQ